MVIRNNNLKLYIDLMVPPLLIILSIMEIDYSFTNLIIKKKSLILKLFFDILLFLLSCYSFFRSDLIFIKIIYFGSIIWALIMFMETLDRLSGKMYKSINTVKSFLMKAFRIFCFPLEIKNIMLYKLYNVKIEQESMPYLNLILIAMLMCQNIVFTFIALTNIEIYCNKYFFAFTTGTFVAHFIIHVIEVIIGDNRMESKKYIFAIRKSFLILLMIELIIIALITNIDFRIVSKLSFIKVYGLNEIALRELFDSTTLCTLILQLLEYRNKIDWS